MWVFEQTLSLTTSQEKEKYHRGEKKLSQQLTNRQMSDVNKSLNVRATK